MCLLASDNSEIYIHYEIAFEEYKNCFLCLFRRTTESQCRSGAERTVHNFWITTCKLQFSLVLLTEFAVSDEL